MECTTLKELQTISKRGSVDNGFMVRQEYNSLTGPVYRFEDDTVPLIDNVIMEGNMSLFTKWQEKFFTNYLVAGGEVTDEVITLDGMETKLKQFDQWLGSYKGEVDGE